MSVSLRHWSPLSLSALLLVACGGSSPPAPAPPAENAQAFSLEAERAHARTLVERACGCDTRECLSSVGAELDAVVLTVGEAVRARADVLACHERVDHKAAAVALDELKVLRRDACACLDAACAEGIQDRFGEFMERHMESKGSEEQAERAGKVAEMMMECVVKAQGNPTAP